MMTSPEPDFLRRTLRTSGAVLLVYLPFGFYYFGFYPTLAVFSGGVWGLINLIFLSALVRAAIRPGGVDGWRVAGYAVFKFPLLYLAGYALLKVAQFGAVHLLIGFSISLAVMILKGLGRAVLKLDSAPENAERVREASS